MQNYYIRLIKIFIILFAEMQLKNLSNNNLFNSIILLNKFKLLNII